MTSLYQQYTHHVHEFAIHTNALYSHAFFEPKMEFEPLINH